MMSMSSRIQFYCKYTTLHGVKYIADDKRPIVIRLFWLFVLLVSLFIMRQVVGELYKSYSNNSISFVTETTFLNWNTTFPAVTFCEISGTEIAWDEEQYLDNKEDLDGENEEDTSIVLQFVSDIIFFTGSCYACNNPCKACEKFNFAEIVKKYKKKCQDLLKTCIWNENDFDCCEQFLPLETEYGVCYSINSLHTNRINNVHRTLMSNTKSGPGSLQIETIEDVRLYIHAPEDVPFINSDPDQRKDVMLGETLDILLNVIEIENDEAVKALPVVKRSCRFPEEKPDDLVVHSYYSYSSCIVQCHAEAHINLCNCTHHLMPVINQQKYCDVEGLLCLTENFETVNRLHAKGFDKPGLVCDCLPSCVEPEYKIVSESKGISDSFSQISITMQSLPTSRFKRIVVRTTMDLIVYIGGTAGLFIGASILSIVELIYLLLLRRG